MTPNHISFSMNSKTENIKAVTRSVKTSSFRINSNLSPGLARLMAGWASISNKQLYFLDPFAGSGQLTTAVCEFISKLPEPRKVKIDLFEPNPAQFSALQKNLATCEKLLKNAGHELRANPVPRHFFEVAAGWLETPPLFSSAESPEYDFILATLPDFRLADLQLPATLFAAGHLDSFTLLMKLAARLLADKGELITLMPRKYGAGLFYKSFRRWLFSELKPTAFCLLPPEIFSLQVFTEPVLVQFKKIRQFPEQIQITATAPPDFLPTHPVKVPTDEILSHRDPDRVLHIPVDAADLELLQFIQTWPLRLDGLGFHAASGKITPKEAGELPVPANEAEPWLPVVWAGNLTEFGLEFPNPELTKIQQVNDSAAARALSVENQRYVLVHRPQQKNRPYPLLAIYHAPAVFPGTRLLLDHEISFITRQRGKFSLFEALGLMALLNSNLVHRYLGLLNGARPVSASQLNRLPLPGIETIIEIGTALNAAREINRELLNRIVGEKLNLSENLLNYF